MLHAGGVDRRHLLWPHDEPGPWLVEGAPDCQCQPCHVDSRVGDHRAHADAVRGLFHHSEVRSHNLSTWGQESPPPLEAHKTLPQCMSHPALHVTSRHLGPISAALGLVLREPLFLLLMWILPKVNQWLDTDLDPTDPWLDRSLGLLHASYIQISSINPHETNLPVCILICPSTPLTNDRCTSHGERPLWYCCLF